MPQDDSLFSTPAQSAAEPPPAERERALLDQLLADAGLYRKGPEFKALLEFVVRLRAFAPFNAMLLHIQRPGLTHAATARDWHTRFGRSVKEKTNPLLILRPFGPVDFVYDIQDTISADGSTVVPRDIASFWASGPVTAETVNGCIKSAERHWIRVALFSGGDGDAGRIRLLGRSPYKGGKSRAVYQVHVNRQHPPSTQLCTLAHELAHLCLGHLGDDEHLRIRGRSGMSYPSIELEAEATTYLVAARNGVASDSHKYLSAFTEPGMTTDGLDLYQVMRAAGQVEGLMGLARMRETDT